MTIREQVFSLIKERIKDPSIAITDETKLIEDGNLLDSMRLVQLSLALEELAEEHHFEFDWTSDSAMSRTRSIFRTAGTLADAFCEQMEKTK